MVVVVCLHAVLFFRHVRVRSGLHWVLGQGVGRGLRWGQIQIFLEIKKFCRLLEGCASNNEDLDWIGTHV